MPALPVSPRIPAPPHNTPVDPSAPPFKDTSTIPSGIADHVRSTFSLEHKPSFCERLIECLCHPVETIKYFFSSLYTKFCSREKPFQQQPTTLQKKPLPSIEESNLIYQMPQNQGWEKIDFENWTLYLAPSDLLLQGVDALVSPIDKFLANQSEYSRQIHLFAGPELQKELELKSKQVCYLSGVAYVTSSQKLPQNYIIHPVEPFYDEEQKKLSEKKLFNTYMTCLIAAGEGYQLFEKTPVSIALSLLSIGTGGFSLQSSHAIAIEACLTYQKKNSGKIDQIRFIIPKVPLTSLKEFTPQLLQKLQATNPSLFSP